MDKEKMLIQRFKRAITFAQNLNKLDPSILSDKDKIRELESHLKLQAQIYLQDIN